MRQLQTPMLWLILCLALSSCDGPGASPATPEASRFTKGFAKGCDLLPAELVASTFDVPAKSLKQTKVLGCIYTWSNDTDELKAHILMARAHKNTSAAVTWFANSTKSRSAQEMQAEMDKVAERLESQTELDTAAKKSAAKIVLNAAGSKAVVFEDVANVGDEARSCEDGSISVRVDNLTFNLSAYNGAKKPRSKFASADVKQMIASAKKDDQEWVTKSAPQRAQDSTKLARAIIATF